MSEVAHDTWKGLKYLQAS